MVATRYGEKRRSRKATVRGSRWGAKGWAVQAVREDPRPQPSTGGAPRFVALGTVAEVAAVSSTAHPALSFLVNGRFEVRVGAGFDEAALARLVRTLERL